MAKVKKNGAVGPFNEGHLDWASVAAILFVYAATKAFLSFPSRMAKAAQTAAWSVPLASAALSVIWIAPLVYVLSKHPGKNLVQITKALAGKPVSFVLGAALYIYNVGLVATGAREVGEALATVILPLTPLNFTLAALFGTGLYVALRGTEIVGRMSLLAAVAVIVHVVLLSLLSLPGWCTDPFIPLLGPGIPELLKTYGVRQAIYGEFLVLGLLAPYLRKRRDIGKATATSGVSTALLLAVTVVACEIMFPYPSLTEIPVPFLRVIRLIYLGRFFQRFDSFFVVLWLGAGSLAIAIGACVSSHIIGSITPLRSYRIGVWITVALSFISAVFITSFSQAIILDFDVIRPYSLILVLGWPWMLLVLHLVGGKKRKPEVDLSDQAGV